MNPLVDVAELRRLLDAGTPVVLVDVSYRMGSPGWGLAQHRAGHLPGARFVDLDEELAGEPFTGSGGRHPLPEPAVLAATLRRLGVEPDLPVVAYDQDGSLGAARLWWLLRDAGHREVRVLDGGLAAWVATGGELSTEELVDAEGGFVPRPGQLPVVHSGAIVDEQRAGHLVVDVRAAERHRGEHEPVDPVAGHIPGAVSLPASELQDGKGRFLAPGQLRERFAGAGVQAGDVLSCGSGLTAAQVLLAAESAGVHGLRLHPGSFSDWIHDPSRPVSTGEQASGMIEKTT